MIVSALFSLRVSTVFFLKFHLVMLGHWAAWNEPVPLKCTFCRIRSRPALGLNAILFLVVNFPLLLGHAMPVVCDVSEGLFALSLGEPNAYSLR